MSFERPIGEKPQESIDQNTEQFRKRYEELGKKAAALSNRYHQDEYGTYDVLRDLKTNAKYWEEKSKEDPYPDQQKRFAAAAEKYKRLLSLSEDMINLRIEQLTDEERDDYRYQHAHLDQTIEQYDRAISAHQEPDKQKKELMDERAQFYAERKRMEQSLPSIP